MIRLEVPAAFTKICTERSCEYTPAGATPFQKEADLALAQFGGQSENLCINRIVPRGPQEDLHVSWP